MSTSTSPTQIPLPPDLPAPWEQPEDAQRFWTTDRMHFPGSLTQLDTVLTNLVYNTGLNHGFEMYDLPVHAAGRSFWAHAYMSIAPRMLPDDELEAMGQRSEAKLQAMMGRQLEQWETVWLPEIKQLLGDLEGFDLPAASLPDLLAHLDVTLRHFERVWKLHFEIVPPAQLSVSLFDEFYREVFGSEQALAAYELVQGFDNLIVRAGAQLWKLSRAARASSEVRAILEERAASEVLDALAASEAGRAFLAALQAYLDAYGQRGGTWGLSHASWIEDPTPVIKNLKDYITQPDTADPDLMLAGLAAERDQALAAARERLQTYPEAVRGQFEFLLKAAQEGNVLSEDHNYWIDFRAAYQVRRVFMEFGRRLAAAGVIERADDIVHLTVDEIRATAEQLPNLDQRARVQERQAELARYASVELPSAIGTQPPGPPPVNPITTMNGKFFGVAPQPSDDPLVLNGAAGSPGVVRGPARVVRSLAEAGRLQAGDILVAETTAPPWTPLFATVAAVVTDTGGALSHCAVVAREYRIPAVVGTGVATARIADGQLIEVDGDRGVVRIIGSESPAVEPVTQTVPQPLPTPDNFPVRWPNAEDVHVFWLVERLHWPDPMTPMDFAFNRDAHEQFSWAFASYGVPLQYNARHLNYRWYYAVTPSVADHSEMPARMQAGLQNLEATIPRLRQLWDEEWLPEVLRHLDFWQSFDLAQATLPELLAHLNETIVRHNRVWQLHFLQTLPVYMAMSTFDDLYQDLFSTSNPLEAYALMQGFDNKTLELGRAVWRLSRAVLASPVLRAAVEGRPVEQVVPELERSEEGRAFLTHWAAFLETYGKRGEKLGVSFVSWIEDPGQAIRLLQEYVNQPELDAEAELAGLAAERESLLADARAKLAGYPQPIVAQFEAMLGFAQQATIISEDHTLYIDFGCMYAVRNVLLEFGRRFAAAGALERAEDVFLLTRDELRQAAEQEPGVVLQATVAARRAEMAHFGGVTPPPALGTPPSGPMPDDPLSRTVGKFFGAPPAPPEGPPEALLLRGGSGSAGRAQGVARVITSLEDAHRLQKGDILVAQTTAPAWTPLFAAAAAVVTDTGGVLSHSAVVAREYRIPAVVGVGLATMLIQDGQLIEVDGDQGVVRILQAG